MSVAYHILNDSLVVNFDGKTEVIASGDKRYENVLEAIREDRLDDIPELVNLVAPLVKAGLDVRDGLIYVKDEPMPEALSKRIMNLVDKQLPVEYLYKFWENIKLNPSYNSRQMLFDFLEHNGHPITQDGCFIAYRGVTNEFLDCHTRTFDNSPGAICEMPREQVDDDPTKTCSSGLHVACHNYANGFGSKTIEVKVNPKDVVAVPKDYNGTKMRVCKFEVIQECEGMRNEDIYNEDNINYEECPHCTNYIDEDMQYCPNCGADLNDAFEALEDSQLF